MANTFITPQNVARTALATFQYNAVLPRVVNRTFVTEFGGGSGDTITIRKQAQLTTNLFDRATGIVTQDVIEDKMTLTVKDIWDISAVITQEQWDLHLTDFAFQVSEPAGKAMVRKSEQIIADALDKATDVMPITNPADPVKDFIEARKRMNMKEVPADNRVWVLGSNVAAAALSSDQLLKADQAGDNGALRNATIGRILGSPVVESVVVDPDKGYLVQRDAVTFISITPQLPRGVANASSASYDGQAMRVVFGYDQPRKQDVVSFDAYLQAEVIRDECLVAMTLGGGAVAAKASK
jgi:hypothetical protein